MNLTHQATSPERQRRVCSTRRWRSGLVSAILLFCLLTTACQQEMARQPYYRPLEQTNFFPDGRSSRQLVDGTVARGRLLEQSPILTYRRDTAQDDVARAIALIGNPAMNAFAALLPFTLGPNTSGYVEVCPIAIDDKAMERGRERFNIYCAVCHDALGTGNGKIVERGYLRPPNYHTDDSRGFARRGLKVHLRDLPIGYYFEVITRGFGAMPDYASQIPPEDRWKIIAYIRALQRSQWTPLTDLDASLQEKVRRAAPAVEERP